MQVNTPKQPIRNNSTSSSASSPFLLSNVPFSNHEPSKIFSAGREHPFANYWTMSGGLPEVVGVLPSRDQANILVAKYFDTIDPVYPMINKRQFHADYEHFWSLPDTDKYGADPGMLALHFVVYAMGTQFIQMPSELERSQLAEFYVSAGHQALRISAYLSRPSIRAVQALVLINYFLMNDNKASDAWAFGGVLTSQACAMGLHRDPDIIVPRASPMEKQQRRKLWQAVFLQDTFLTVLLKLPPRTTFNDVSVNDLTEDPEPEPNEAATNGIHTPVQNPMSISSIAPSSISPTPNTAASDIAYIRSMWQLTILVQRAICTPRALSKPLTDSPHDKAALVNSFRTLYASFPPHLTNTDHAATARLVSGSPRLARQSLFLRSNFWHCMMLVQADDNEQGGVCCEVRGTLEAGREAMNAFFHLWEFLRVDAEVWWVFQHRAFQEAVSLSLPPCPRAPYPHLRWRRARCAIAEVRIDGVDPSPSSSSRTSLPRSNTRCPCRGWRARLRGTSCTRQRGRTSRGCSTSSSRSAPVRRRCRRRAPGCCGWPTRPFSYEGGGALWMTVAGQVACGFAAPKHTESARGVLLLVMSGGLSSMCR